VQLLRSTLLWASQNRRVERLVRSSRAMRPLVSRFMPGETIAELIPAIERLQAENTPVVVTYLGENVATDADGDATVAEYRRLLDAIKPYGAKAHVSIKLTQFGWDIDRARALDRVRIVSDLASANGTVMAIDVESSPYVKTTVEAYEQLAAAHRDVALCLQAYLHRTPADVQRLLPLRPWIRLVKGAYRESPVVALQTRRDVDARYREIANTLLGAATHGARAVFGTHDMALIERIRANARVLGISDTAYEIQMLYGIQEAGRRLLASQGMRTRVLISYGRAWYPWFMRRLAEKPSNLMMVSRNLFS
jgi:proline dehydrogenase